MSSVSPLQQRTLATSITWQGVGLHSGEVIHCRIRPLPADCGRVFVRVDLPGQPQIPATLASLQASRLSTRLQQADAQIQTVEHLLAALSVLGIDNCQIEVDGSELPILDGSALPFVEGILQAGIVAQTSPRRVGIIRQAVTVWEGDAFVTASPSPISRYTYGIDFADSPIQNQWLSWRFSSQEFVTSIGPARTFTREQDIEQARRQGLIKGGSLDNAVVCSATGWHNSLRFADEPVRHKLIDLLGDLSLIGLRLQGHILAYKAGHHLHHQLSRQLVAADALELSTPLALSRS